MSRRTELRRPVSGYWIGEVPLSKQGRTTYHLPPARSSRASGSSFMGKRLIIAEKPSVSADIARALGGFTRHDDHFERNEFVLSSAVGHLVEIGMPEEEAVKRGKWTFTHLPAVPSYFELKPLE